MSSITDGLINQQHRSINVETHSLDPKEHIKPKVNVIPKNIKQKINAKNTLNARLSAMIELYNQGLVEDSKLIALEITQSTPQNGTAWKILGAIYQQQNLKDLAEDALKNSVKWSPTDAESYYNIANFYFDSAQFDLAVAHYQEAIYLDPNFTKAHFNLASVYQKTNELKLAINSLNIAYALEPTNLRIRLSYASVLAEDQQNLEAIPLLLSVLADTPENAAVHFSLAVLYQKVDQLEEALVHYEKTIYFDGSNVEALNNAALILKTLGQYDASEAYFKQAITVNPNSSASYNNLGFLYKDLKRVKEAETCFKKSLVLDKESAPAYSNYGLLMFEIGNFLEAELFCLRALEIDPDYDCAHINYGLVLINLNRLEEAIKHFEAAIAVNPNHFMAMANLAIPLKKLNRLGEAEKYLKKAIEVKPDYFNAHLNLGSIYQGQGKLVDCIESTLKAIEVSPESTAAYSNLLFDLSYTDAYSTEFKVENARTYGALLSKLAEFSYTDWHVESSNKKLRVGFVSGDFLEHPVSYFLRNVVSQMNQNQFELHAYTTDAREDTATAVLKNHLQWHTLVGLNDQEAAERIHKDGIHILIDLSGHTSGNRLPIFAYKPAPVQVTWLGYWSTTGVEQMDYLIADKTSLPDHIQNQFTEQIKYIPETRFCFAPPNIDLQPSPLPALQNQFLTLGCYQNFAKVSDEVLELWSEVIKAIPNAILRWQAGSFKDQAVVSQTLNRLENAGIAENRVHLIGSTSREDYLKSYQEVDFLLDCFPFSGCTTTCEGLWMGLPTLTLPQNSMVSRQGASFMTAVGLPNWVASSKKDFVEKAQSIAGNLVALSELRRNLRAQMRNSLVGDGALFAQNLEKILMEMWNEKIMDLGVLEDERQESQISAKALVQTSEAAPAESIDSAINEVYQLAFKHHMDGEIDEAEKLYLEILQVQPKHADANHNLGFIETERKGAEAALPRFEVALIENPNSEQFWVSFIDALNMIGETATAKAAIEQGRNIAITQENADALNSEIDAALWQQNQKLNCFSDAVPAENKHIKFLIVTPAYTAKSAGIFVMHQLCHDLNELGYPTAIVISDVKDVTYSNNPKYYGPNLNYYAINGEAEFRQFINESIVVYPEIVIGNPLNAKRIVRYILNTEGFVANNKMNESDEDFIISYSPVYRKNPDAFLTKIPYNPIFNNEHTLPALSRNLDVTYVGKGNTYGECFTLPNSLEITRLYPASKQELALVLRNTRYFYTWDYRSATITEAILCGAIPVFLSSAPFASFDALDDHDLAKHLRTTCEINGEKVTVHIPENTQAVLEAHKNEYMGFVEQYPNQLLEALQKIKKHFDIQVTLSI